MSTILPIYSLDLCMKHWLHRYSVDASQLSRGAGQSIFGQAYNDSADEGLVLHSPRTGNTCKFVVSRTHYNVDNDITHWVLTSCPTDMRRLRLREQITLTVWNT